MSAEDELDRLVAAHKAAAQQLQSEVGKVAEMLSAFRDQLVARHFTTAAAEDLVLEWYIRILDGSPSDDD
jgi:uncharacterized membrane-anchored protein YhcB (DUF1043 family)